MQTEAKSVAPPAKPPRLKPNNAETHVKKQLQFQSPLPGRSRAAAATDAASTMATKATKPRRTPAKSKTPPASSQRDAAADASTDTAADATTAIRSRLAEGCTTLMYACLRGDIVQVLAQMRAK
ncbi:uncharacterized protein LOC115564339, partial [Drosophila navojoa]